MTTEAAVESKTITVGELKANGYTLAKKCEDKDKVLELLNYLDFLAMNNAFPADGLAVPLNLGSLERGDLNTLYFAFMEQEKNKDKANIVLPSDSMKKSILASIDRRRETSVARLRSSVERYKSEAINYMSAGDMKLRDARKFQMDIEFMLKEDQTSFMDGMIESISSTNFNIHHFHERDQIISFVNRSDVILNYKEPKAGIDYSINCGKYMVQIYLVDMGIIFKRFQGNVLESNSGRYIHPHARDNDAPCWGNAADTVANARVKGDIGTIIKVIDSILQNYNPDSPYVSIEEFKEYTKYRDAENARIHARREAAKQKGETAPEEAQEGDEYDDEQFLEDDFADVDDEAANE